ncbi:MAG: DUF1611 domain-containing protein [Planctomycetales bacterium]|nr:DUF1611 domain-containing protein [Planctomycetales bacterium]
MRNTPLTNSSFPQHKRIVLITDGYSTPFSAKTAISLLRYRTDDIAAVLDGKTSAKTAGELFGVGGSIPVVPELSDVSDADALYVGIAPPGGRIPPEWRSLIKSALARSLDVVSGMHEFLVDDDEYPPLAEKHGARLVDVRRNRHKTTAKAPAIRRGCCRIHSVGHDCAIGKMVTTLEIQAGLTAAGHDARFLATGQTGIMISGTGVPIDCVVSDFVNGAAEQLILENQEHDFLLIEGQGSISHPSFSAVTLGLLHGSAPDGLVFCYEAGRTHVKGLDGVEIPPLGALLRTYEALAQLRHPCRIIGIAINTRNLDESAARREIEMAEATYELPSTDVYRFGAKKLVAAAVALREELLAS